MKDLAQPIRPNEDDRLTRETGLQIEKHNNRIWCQFPELRPLRFDSAVCVTRLIEADGRNAG